MTRAILALALVVHGASPSWAQVAPGASTRAVAPRQPTPGGAPTLAPAAPPGIAAQPTLGPLALAAALPTGVAEPRVPIPGPAPVTAASRALLSKAGLALRRERGSGAPLRAAETLRLLFDGAVRLAEPAPPPEVPPASRAPESLSAPGPRERSRRPELPKPTPPLSDGPVLAKAKAAGAIALAILLLLIGLTLLVLPGPGLPFIVLALVILARYFRWAKEALWWLKRRAAVATQSLRRWRRARLKR